MSPSSLEVNNHHNVPRSRGGVRSRWNLSPVRVPRHIAFNRWASIRTPTEIIRVLLLSTIGHETKTIPPALIRGIMGGTNFFPWKDLYHPRALARRSTRRYEQKNRYFLLEETFLIRQAMAALRDEVLFPAERLKVLREALQFFSAKTPLDALHGFMEEEFHHKLTWVHALREEVRGNIMALLDSAVPESMDGGTREELQRVLKDHEEILLYEIGEWDTKENQLYREIKRKYDEGRL